MVIVFPVCPVGVRVNMKLCRQPVPRVVSVVLRVLYVRTKRSPWPIGSSRSVVVLIKLPVSAFIPSPTVTEGLLLYMVKRVSVGGRSRVVAVRVGACENISVNARSRDIVLLIRAGVVLGFWAGGVGVVLLMWMHLPWVVSSIAGY